MRSPAAGSSVLPTVPPGSPDQLRVAARQLSRAARGAMATATVRGTAVADLGLVWSGPAATTARGELSTLSARTSAVLPDLDAGSLALATFADGLQRAQLATRRLIQRVEDVELDHARALATARVTAVTDPATSQVIASRADARRADELRRIDREHGRVLDDLSAASTRCCAVLGRLTPTPGWVMPADPLGDLPMTRGLVDDALQPPAGRAPEQGWFGSAVDATVNAGAWTYNHAVVPVVNTAADLADAAVDHPEDVVGMAGGVGLAFLGAGGQLGAVALDATGVGTLAGVPLHAAAAGLIASGATIATASAVQLGQHTAANDNMLLKEVPLRPGTRGMGGDPLPDSGRPVTAGATWKGRIANNGNGVVWQRPQDMCPPPKLCNANSIRINDPETKTFGADRSTVDYPDGYVRFYNPGGQPLKLDGHPGSEAETHIPINPDRSTYPIPKGWNP